MHTWRIASQARAFGTEPFLFRPSSHFAVDRSSLLATMPLKLIRLAFTPKTSKAILGAVSGYLSVSYLVHANARGSTLRTVVNMTPTRCYTTGVSRRAFTSKQPSKSSHQHQWQARPLAEGSLRATACVRCGIAAHCTNRGLIDGPQQCYCRLHKESVDADRAVATILGHCSTYQLHRKSFHRNADTRHCHCRPSNLRVTSDVWLVTCPAPNDARSAALAEGKAGKRNANTTCANVDISIQTNDPTGGHLHRQCRQHGGEQALARARTLCQSHL